MVWDAATMFGLGIGSFAWTEIRTRLTQNKASTPNGTLGKYAEFVIFHPPFGALSVSPIALPEAP